MRREFRQVPRFDGVVMLVRVPRSPAKTEEEQIVELYFDAVLAPAYDVRDPYRREIGGEAG